MALNRALVHDVARVRYLVHPQVVGRITESVPFEKIVPAIVLSDDLSKNGPSQVNARLDLFEKIDDVYQPEFADIVVLLSNQSDPEVPVAAENNISDLFSTIYHSRQSATGPQIFPGPYFLLGSNIHQAWRLYQDNLDAFIFGVIPDDVFKPEKYSPVDAASPDGVWKSIAVPSRLYSNPSKKRPLAGARMGLKDIFGLAGVKTTMMSRAYSELYRPEEESAEYVKKLIDLGAIIVGKTKMTQFASSDEPTDQWIDFHCPINPRGDQYQSPSGSSSGAAAALAGYPWLDHSIAGDSAGSVRAPATCNGLYSIRPSFGSTSMKGVMINSPLFDVVGLFSRSLEDLHHIASCTLDLADASTKFPKKILYPLDFFPHSNPEHQAMVDEFISVLGKFLGTERVEFSIAERWSQCPPPEAKGKTLKEYLAKASSAFWPMCYDYYHGFDGFRNQYKATFEKDPYEGPVVHYRWGIGKSVTPEDYKNYTHELEVFRTWFDENIFSNDPETLSEAIMIMPYGSAKPKYRDESNEAPSSAGTVGEKFISPVLHMPQLVLPSDMEARSDLMLIKLAKAAFEAESWPTKIATGRYMFPLGDNVRNVASL
ncbi:putative Amidase [Seiridium cardinale]|uniref:Amidase n=1 Tax=Seiridium cardinale TaxID=138064 RepID=A0ABR2X873_9PEZI